MDLRRLRSGEWTAAVAGVVLLVSLFLPWYERDEEICIAVVGFDCPRTDHVSGWEALAVIDLFLAVAALGALAMWLVTATQRTVAVAIALNSFLVLGAAIAFVLVAIRVLDQPDLGQGYGLSWGAVVAALAAAGLLVGSWRSLRDERRSPPGRSTDITGRPAPPAPPVEPIPPPRRGEPAA
jgi:hypothetical protein